MPKTVLTSAKRTPLIALHWITATKRLPRDRFRECQYGDAARSRWGPGKPLLLRAEYPANRKHKTAFLFPSLYAPGEPSSTQTGRRKDAEKKVEKTSALSTRRTARTNQPGRTKGKLVGTYEEYMRLQWAVLVRTKITLGGAREDDNRSSRCLNYQQKWSRTSIFK